MKRRLAMRDRMVWIVSVVAVGIVLYLVLPIWIIGAALALIVGGLVLVRRSRRHRVRR